MCQQNNGTNELYVDLTRCVLRRKLEEVDVVEVSADLTELFPVATGNKKSPKSSSRSAPFQLVKYLSTQPACCCCAGGAGRGHEAYPSFAYASALRY